jgi:N4-gp56 family major capsid protein
MPATIIGVNDPKSNKKWSGELAVDTARKSYFTKKFSGVGVTSSTPIQVLQHLENEAGDNISFDISMQLRSAPIEGDNKLQNNEESLTFYTDNLFIDQARFGVNAGGRMTRKRTLHDLRKVAKARMSEWWARMFDEQFFMYLSGARGINNDYLFPLNYTGRANNSFSAPDAEHLMYGGAATSKATLAATDKITLGLIDRLKTKATMMGGGTTGTPQIQPIMIDGEEHYVFLMSPFQEYDLRNNATDTKWVDLQKALVTAEGKNTPIFKGALGMYNNVVLHSHKSVTRFSDYGAGSNVAAARGLFLGEQAAVCAFGSPGTGMRFDWFEDLDDRGNVVVIDSGSIFGIKKTTFNNKDYGVIAVDAAAADPN